jgi:hypothetical protein
MVHDVTVATGERCAAPVLHHGTVVPQHEHIKAPLPDIAAGWLLA